MLKVTYVPAFNDNYIWVLEDAEQHCVVIDPGQSEPILKHIQQRGLILDAVLITHHHPDHVDGLSELKSIYPNIRVYGSAFDQLIGLTHPLQGNEHIRLLGESFLVLDTPGHTEHHISYLGDGKLFCGDVLFSAGCGRVANNAYKAMFDTLNMIKALPLETEVYCSHEYTSTNLAFAFAVDPSNSNLHLFRDHINRLKAQALPTLPTTLYQEKLINPFLRLNDSSIISSIQTRTKITDQLSIFTALRQWKDEF